MVTVPHNVRTVKVAGVRRVAAAVRAGREAGQGRQCSGSVHTSGPDMQELLAFSIIGSAGLIIALIEIGR